MTATARYRDHRIALCGRAIEAAPASGATWWPELAPLTAPERVIVKKEIARRAAEAAEKARESA